MSKASSLFAYLSMMFFVLAFSACSSNDADTAEPVGGTVPSGPAIIDNPLITDSRATLQLEFSPEEVKEAVFGVVYSCKEELPSLENACKVECKLTDDDFDGKLELTLEALMAKKTYNYRTFVKRDGREAEYGELQSFTTAAPIATRTPAAPNAVNLGLPTGTLWADCNLGATVPQDTGYFIAWGEVDKKLKYTWNTYRYSHGNSDAVNKYITLVDSVRFRYYVKHSIVANNTIIPDDERTLLLSDDAANVMLGGYDPEWHIPNRTEWLELYTNCTRKVVVVNGTTGKKRCWEYTGPNGNSILLPMGGYNCCDSVSAYQELGYYATADVIQESRRFAYGVEFTLLSDGHIDTDAMPYLYPFDFQTPRYIGVQIRPVKHTFPLVYYGTTICDRKP